MSIKRNPKNKWTIALQAVLEKQVDDVPKDWLTTHGVAREMNLSEEQAGKAITIMKRKGALEVKNFRIKTEGKTGLIKSVAHYKLLPLTSFSKQTARKVSALGKS